MKRNKRLVRQKKVPDESKQTKETELVPYQQGDLPKEESSNVDSPKSEPKTQRAVSDDPSSISSGAIPDIEVANEPRFELPQEDKSNPNMNIWSEVHKTDRQFCKKDHQGMTSINTQYRIMAATRLFGPRGIGWNFEEIERWVEETAPIIINGQLTEHKETIHHVKVSIWFKVGGEKSEPITHFGSCKSMYMAKGGYFVADEEPYKKALSDALGKCLSTIGIGADVYLGEHDDFHVETLTKNEVDSKLELRQIEEEDRIRKETMDKLESIKEQMQNAPNASEVNILRQKALATIGALPDINQKQKDFKSKVIQKLESAFNITCERFKNKEAS